MRASNLFAEVAYEQPGFLSGVFEVFGAPFACFKFIGRIGMSNIGLSAVFAELWGAGCVLQIHWQNWHMSNIGLSAVFLQLLGAVSVLQVYWRSWYLASPRRFWSCGVPYACFNFIGGVGI